MRAEKQSMIAEVEKRLKAATCVYMVDCRGMKSEGLTNLRIRVRQAGGRLQVAKNSMVKVAAKGVGMIDVSPVLDGPTAMVVGQGDAVVLAKALTDFAKENSAPVIKGGVLGARLLGVKDVQSIAELPSREVLIGKTVSCLAAPLQNLVGVMHQKVASLLYALKAVGEQKQKAV